MSRESRRGGCVVFAIVADSATLRRAVWITVQNCVVALCGSMYGLVGLSSYVENLQYHEQPYVMLCVVPGVSLFCTVQHCVVLCVVWWGSRVMVRTLPIPPTCPPSLHTTPHPQQNTWKMRNYRLKIHVEVQRVQEQIQNSSAYQHVVQRPHSMK